MRLRRGIALGVSSVLAGAGLVACFDLFHSTSDVLTACEIDASHPGCGAPAPRPEAVETDFCARSDASADRARERALHACSWLGACEGPMGNNAFGPCYFHALMAYDCSINPNHRVHDTTHRLWDCLQRAKTCGQVDLCVFGDGGAPGCESAGDYTTCASDAGTEAVRAHCSGGGTRPFPGAQGENCALWGQTCAEGPAGSLCAGNRSSAPCEASGCSPSRSSLRWCDTGDGGTGLNLGVDCTSYGGTCAGFPSETEATWVACTAETDASGPDARCTPDPSATCDAGIATSCPSGTWETLDCATLLHSASACTEGPLDPTFDWTSPCVPSAPECLADSCDVDADLLTSCHRQAGFSVGCKSEGLGPCRLIQADPASSPRAACGPPSPVE